MPYTPREPWKVLDQFRGSFFTGEWPSLPELFDISAHRFPERPCFTIYENGRQSLSYAQARERVLKLAGYIAASGLQPGDRVVVTGKNAPEWAVAYLAVLYAGCVVVPLDHQLRMEEAEALIRASGAGMVFCDEEKFDLFAAKKLDIKGLYSISAERKPYLYDLEAKATLNAERKPKEADLAAILFTSGTMGDPKGVMLSHANLTADCFLSQGNLLIFPTDVFYALLPIHHSYTMLAVFIEAMSVGAEIVFAKRMAIAQVLRDFKEAKVTMFLGVPMLFNKLINGIMAKIKAKGAFVYGIIRALMLVSGAIKKATGINPGKKIFHSILEQASLSTLRICISGGGPLAPSVFADYNRLGLDFVQGYGLTETSPIVTLNPIEHYKPTSVGRLVPGAQMKVLSPDANGNGELAIKGPMVMQGYYKNEAATQAVFTEDGWFKTGDVGRLDAESYVYLTGRAKNMIVTEGGKNVYPEEIENEFQLFGEVEQVLIRGYVADKAARTEGIEVFIYPAKDFFEARAAAGNALKEAQIKARIEAIVAEVNSRLLPYSRISRSTVLDKPLEMTTTRKVKRHAVK